MLLFFLLAFFFIPQIPGVRSIQNKYSYENWTCEEFLNDTKIDPLQLIDIDWKIFYFWNFEFEKSFHIKFNIPTRELIERFKRLDDELHPPVKWTQVELFMETSVDLSGLLVRTENPGEYRLIPSLSFEYTATPLSIFGFKLVDGYLGIMNCKYRLGYALSPVERMPNATNIEKIARSMNFNSPFGYSYLKKDEDPSPSPPVEDMDDAEDDAQLEIDREINQLRMI